MKFQVLTNKYHHWSPIFNSRFLNFNAFLCANAVKIENRIFIINNTIYQVNKFYKLPD